MGADSVGKRPIFSVTTARRGSPKKLDGVNEVRLVTMAEVAAKD